MKNKLLFIFVLAFGIVSISNAQTFPFRTYSIQDGLSESVVYDIIQDHEGYLWLATGYGLNKFDGFNFINFFEESGLNHSKVYSLYQSRDRKIWIGTELGVNFFNGDSIYSPVDLSALENSKVIAIFEDSQGGMWFGTDGDGVWNYSITGEMTLYSTSQGFLSNQVRAINESENGKLWFATREGVTLLENGDLRNFTTTDGLPENRIRDVKVDSKGIIWIATRNGISRYDGRNFQNFGTDEGILDSKIQTISLAEDGSVWTGSEMGLSQFKNETFTNYTTDQGLSNDIIYSSIIDKEGNIWIGTFGGGVSIFLGSYIENYTTDTGLSNDLVTSIVEDEAGKVWISTYGGGLISKLGNRFEYLAESEGLPDDRVYHLSKDSKGIMWIGMRDGLATMENGIIKSFSDKKFPFRKVRHVMESSKGEHWVSTNDEGIVNLGKNDYQSYTINEGLASNTVLASVEDEEGNIWVATYGGVSKISGNEIKNFTIQDGLPNNGVMSIIKDNAGTIWVSTFGGIAWFDGVRFIDITDEDGLPDRVCYFIKQDDDNILWVGTNAGIARLDIELYYSEQREEKESAIQIITREQGLISDEMNLGAVYKDKQGHFWFGTVEGVSRFNPATYKGNEIPPEVEILSFSASGREYETRNLELPHSKNFIEIEFAGLNFTSPNQVNYEYILSGIDPEWQRTTSRFAKYQSLPPGDYSFRVHARNSNGVWNKEIALVQFRILPPFWLSWWFVVIIFSVVIGIIYLFYRNYKFMKMVDIERIRVRIASDLHDDVGTSLTEIALQSDFLQAGNIDSEFKKSLTHIGKQCRHVVTSLDDIVWSIDARNDTLGDLTDRMQDYIINVLVPKGINVAYDFEELKMDNKLPVPVKENLYLIFKEAVNNVAKYSNGDEVLVSMNSRNGEFEFKVHDNGTTGKGTKKTGQGLRNMEMRAQRIGGIVDFEVTNGFTVTIKGKLN